MTTKAQLIAAEYTKVVERIALYETAEEAILGGAQSYSIGNRTLTRADLVGIANILETLKKKQMKLLNSGSIRIQRVVPRDI